VRGYVEDPGAVAAAMQGVDAVINCAALLPNALASVPREAFHRVNVEGAVNVLHQAARHGVPRTVFLSTISVVDHISRTITPETIQEYVPDPHDAYLASKISCEKALQEASQQYPGEVSVLRPAFIYGPGNYAVWGGAFRLVRQGKMWLIGGGDVPLPLIYGGDIARFLVHLFSRPPGRGFPIHVLPTPHPTSRRRRFDVIADRLRARRPRSVPCWLLQVGAMVAAMLPRSLRRGRLKLLTRARVQQYSRGYDLSGVLNPPPLGFTPPTGYREGLTHML